MRTPYRLSSGRIVPSVTTIIDSQLGWNKRILMAWSRREALSGVDPQELLEAAGDIGTEVHTLIESHVKGKELPVVSTEALTAFDAFLKWDKQNSLEYVHSELRLVNEEHEYGGTTDIIARSRESLWLIDPKSSKGIYPEFYLQVAAYKYAFEADYEKIGEVHLLHLSKDDGSFADHFISERKLSLAWEAFLHCRQLYKIQKELK